MSALDSDKVKRPIADYFLGFSHNHAAPLTPLESPNLALLSTVETSSEKIYSAQIFGTFE